MPKCEFCGNEFDGDATDLGAMTYICQDCLEEQYTQCDRCGNWNDSSFVTYYYLVSDECVCENCFNPETDEEDEDYDDFEEDDE